MRELNARPLNGFGRVGKRLAVHVHRHQLVGDIGRREERRHRVTVRQGIEQADRIRRVLLGGDMARICPCIVDVAGAAEIVKIQIAAAQLIDLSIAPADAGTFVRFGDAVHDKIRRKADPVSVHRTACLEQNLQAGLVSPDHAHFMEHLKCRFMHGSHVIIR